jgi:hypothetical protein
MDCRFRVYGFFWHECGVLSERIDKDDLAI